MHALEAHQHTLLLTYLNQILLITKVCSSLSLSPIITYLLVYLTSHLSPHSHHQMITCISSIKSSSSSSIISLIFLQEGYISIYIYIYIKTSAKVPEARFVMVTANKTRLIFSAKQIGMYKGEGEGRERGGRGRGESRRDKERRACLSHRDYGKDDY